MSKDELELKACENLNEARRRLNDIFNGKDKLITSNDVRNAANAENTFFNNGYWQISLKSEVLEWELYLGYLRTASECIEQLGDIVADEEEAKGKLA